MAQLNECARACGGRFCGRYDKTATMAAQSVSHSPIACIHFTAFLLSKCWNLLKWHNNLTCTDNDLKSAEDDINCVTCKRHDRTTAITNDANNARVRMHGKRTRQEKAHRCLTTTPFFFLSPHTLHPTLALHPPSSILVRGAFHFHFVWICICRCRQTVN